MKKYVVHYTKGNGPNVRKYLEGIIPDAHFITQYDKEDFFVSWVKTFTGTNTCMPYLSCNLKHIEALKDMVDNNIEEAFIFEDDVVFIDDWENKFMTVKRKYFDSADYIKMGNLHELSYDQAPLMVGNNGGAEGQYVTLEFAKKFLKKVNVEHTIDIMHHGFLGGGAIPCIPVCAQTSIITRYGAGNNQDEPLPEWREYTMTYHQRKFFEYDTLLKEYESFLKRKAKLEELFFKRYGKRVEIKRVEYVYKNEFMALLS
jgi:GR25 family glycosyltransferase involved in LPS biosynthesis